jgi:hypothetical protein
MGPRAREDVRFNQLGLFVHEDGRRVAVGFEITPFLERPSIDVVVTDEFGRAAANMTVIEALHTNFTLTLHLRDMNPTGKHEVTATLYYFDADRKRLVVDSASRTLDPGLPGEQ